MTFARDVGLDSHLLELGDTMPLVRLLISSWAACAAVPGLIRCAACDCDALRVEAAISLAAIGGPPDQVVLELTRLLRERAVKENLDPERSTSLPVHRGG